MNRWPQEAHRKWRRGCRQQRSCQSRRMRSSGWMPWLRWRCQWSRPAGRGSWRPGWRPSRLRGRQQRSLRADRPNWIHALVFVYSRDPGSRWFDLHCKSHCQRFTMFRFGPSSPSSVRWRDCTTLRFSSCTKTVFEIHLNKIIHLSVWSRVYYFDRQYSCLLQCDMKSIVSLIYLTAQLPGGKEETPECVRVRAEVTDWLSAA